MPVALISGVLGQDGRLLTELLLNKGYQVHGTTRSNSAASDDFAGEKKIKMHALRLDQPEGICTLVEKLKADEIYHFAARSSSAQLSDDPVATANINGLSVLYFLEAIKNSSAHSKFCFASSSEVFAGINVTPQSEKSTVTAINPYGIAKSFGMQWVAHYRHAHGLFAASAILYNHESSYRSPHFVTRKITSAAAGIYLGKLSSLTLGGLESQRDWMHASDAVRGMWAVLQAESAQDFVFGSGELHSVRDICDVAFSHLKLDFRDYVVIKRDTQRREDRIQLRADISAAKSVLGWAPTVSFEKMIQDMVDFDVNSASKS
jgi:GDPmannose 4,6-dehydratase